MSLTNATPRSSSQPIHDWLFKNTTRFFACVVLAALIGIVALLVIGAMPSIKQFGWGFLTSMDWNPAQDMFGALGPMLGTLVTSAIALLIGVPVSFGIALFLTELSPRWLKRPLGVAIELLAGIPSIIYGMWGLYVFAPWFGEHARPWLVDHVGSLPVIGQLFQGGNFMGVGIFTAGFILAIMIIPYIASVMRDVFEIVPSVLKESAYGLGSTTWEVVWKVVLPYTRSGVIGGIMLGLGRALGETMAVTFVIGNSNMFSKELFSSGSSIASTIANEFNEAYNPMHTAALIELGLVLCLITLVVLALSKLLLLRMAKGEGEKT